MGLQTPQERIETVFSQINDNLMMIHTMPNNPAGSLLAWQAKLRL